MPSPNDIVDLLTAAAKFLFVGIVVKYIIIRWLADQILKLFKYCFVRSERTLAIWLHYRNQALNRGHRDDTPIDCNDGGCKII